MKSSIIQMSKIYFFILFLMLHFLCNSCQRREDYIHKPMLNSLGHHIGDSILVNGILKKIVFTDSLYVIDSIVFFRYDKDTIQSVRTFKNGRPIFSNSEYYPNGNLKKYLFIDDDNANYFYERDYDTLGNFVSAKGELFFQGYINDLNSATLEIKKGTKANIQIFLPNPPDCDVRLYVKNEKEGLLDVFHRSKFISFLQTTSWDNDEQGDYKIDIWMDFQIKGTDSIAHYNRELIYKVR